MISVIFILSQPVDIDSQDVLGVSFYKTFSTFFIVCCHFLCVFLYRIVDNVL